MGNVSDIALERALAHLLTEHSKPVSSEYLRTDEIYNPTLQIDWVTAKVPFYYKGKLNGGNIINTTPDGEIEYSIDKRLPITGSYDSRLSVRTSDVLPNGDTWQIEISGNPVKWFQGHNVFGSSDLPNLIYETVIKLSKVLNSPQPDDWLSGVKRGCYTLSRVDITGMYSLPCRSDVYAWLNHAEKTSRTRAGTAVSKGNTVYLNKSSARWNVVMYSKGLELKKHSLPSELDGCGIDSFADNKLRIELRLRGKELSKLNLKIGINWLNLDPWLIYKDYIGRVQMSEQNMREKDLFDIPSHARMTYELWSRGADVRQFVKKTKYYKDRSALLKFGIDISTPKNTDDSNVNIVPLKRILELQPAGVPDWAYGTELMFEPRKICG